MIRVSYQTISHPDENDNLAGNTVAEILEKVEGLLEIPSGVSAKVNGESVDMDTEVEAGDKIEFLKQSGDKG